MGDKEKLLTDADEAYGELRETISGLDEREARQVWFGTWGVREILIHIAAWDRAMTPALGRIGRREPPYPAGVSYDDADAWNARFVEARKTAKLADILGELELSHRDFVAAAAALDDEHFTSGAPARDIFDGNSAQHYREHARQIREWRRTA
jgi:hypothetical protein